MKSKFLILLMSSLIVLSMVLVSCSKNAVNLNDTTEHVESNVVDNKSGNDVDAKQTKAKAKEMIDSLLVFAKDGEEAFEYAYNYRKSRYDDRKGFVTINLSLSIANVSGKAIAVDDFNKYMPKCIISIGENRIEGTFVKIYRGFDETIENQYFTNIWMDHEAIWVDYSFLVPEEYEYQEQVLLINYGENDIIVSNSITEVDNYNDAIQLSPNSNVDFYYLSLPTATNLGHVINMLMVNRDNNIAYYAEGLSGELSYVNDGETKLISGGSMTNWETVYIKSNEATMETFLFGSQGASLKTGVYSLSVKLFSTTIATIDYLVIDSTTYNQLTNQEG